MREPFIGALVLLHFVIGLLCFFEPPSTVRSVPALGALMDFYDTFDFAQTWRMFAPPAQTADELAYSFLFSRGWTPLLPMNRFLEEQAAGRRFLPRGYLRLANHLRHPNFHKKSLKEEPFFYMYFQELSAFFCFGDGALPDLQAIRFYSVVKGIPPFFKTDRRGHPLPKAEDYDKVEAIYERGCHDR